MDEDQTLLLLLLHPERQSQQLNERAQMLGLGQLGGGRTYHFQAEKSPPIPEGAALALVVQQSQSALELALGHRIGNQFLSQLGGGLLQHAGELGILPAHRPAALLDAAVVLAAVKKSGELPVDRCQKLGKVDAPAGKVGREVPRLSLAPLHHGLGGVVEGVEGSHIAPLPALAAQGAGAAHLTGRPVKDGGHIVVIPGRPKGGTHGFVEGAEGVGSVLQAAAGALLGGLVRIGGHGGGEPPAQLFQGHLRQQEKDHRT